MFPLVITYKRVLKGQLSNLSDQDILKIFRRDFMRTGVDHIVMETDSCLTFRNNLRFIQSGGNWNRWVGIRSGKVAITQTQDRRVLVYSINLVVFYAAGIAAGILFSIFSENVWLFLFGFLGLGMMNVFVAALRHSDYLVDLFRECVRITQKR
jgi:hypothetical protein